MYRKILLAYNGTREGQAALRQGAELALLCRARVYLLAVMNLPMGFILAESAQPSGISEQERRRVEQILNEGVERLRQRGLEVEGRLAYGDPAVEIGALGREVGADLIVIGHKHKGALARWWAGSVNYSLLAHTPCSILVAVLTED